MSIEKTAGEVSEKILQTATLAPSTRARPANTNLIADWFGFTTFGEPMLEQMLLAAHRFATALKAWEPNPFLVLLGTSAAGKTHLARRIFRWFDEMGKWYPGPHGANLGLRGSFIRWPDFIKNCREGDSSKMDDMFEDNLLVIDDLGAGADERGWMTDKLFHLLDRRILPFALNAGERRKPRATLITANMALEQLAESYGPRIASRLIRLGKDNVIEVETMDYALRVVGQFQINPVISSKLQT